MGLLNCFRCFGDGGEVGLGAFDGAGHTIVHSTNMPNHVSTH
jgi:hypothetical protein